MKFTGICLILLFNSIVDSKENSEIKENRKKEQEHQSVYHGPHMAAILCSHREKSLKFKCNLENSKIELKANLDETKRQLICENKESLRTEDDKCKFISNLGCLTSSGLTLWCENQLIETTTYRRTWHSAIAELCHKAFEDLRKNCPNVKHHKTEDNNYVNSIEVKTRNADREVTNNNHDGHKPDHKHTSTDVPPNGENPSDDKTQLDSPPNIGKPPVFVLHEEKPVVTNQSPSTDKTEGQNLETSNSEDIPPYIGKPPVLILHDENPSQPILPDINLSKETAGDNQKLPNIGKPPVIPYISLQMAHGIEAQDWKRLVDKIAGDIPDKTYKNLLSLINHSEDTKVNNKESTNGSGKSEVNQQAETKDESNALRLGASLRSLFSKHDFEKLKVLLLDYYIFAKDKHQVNTNILESFINHLFNANHDVINNSILVSILSDLKRKYDPIGIAGGESRETESDLKHWALANIHDLSFVFKIAEKILGPSFWKDNDTAKPKEIVKEKKEIAVGKKEHQVKSSQ